MRIGERAPDFALPSAGTVRRFYGLAGGAPMVLVFPPSGSEGRAAAPAFVTALEGRLTAIIVAREEIPNCEDSLTFLDRDGKVSEAFGAGADGGIVVLDPSLRVLEVVDFGEPGDSAARAVDALSRLPPLDARRVVAQAPVLLVPRVLEPEACAMLIDVWSRRGNEETGVETVETASPEGRANVVRHEMKRRRDHIVEDETLIRMLAGTLGRRLMPELRQVFAFPATRFEGFKIVRYDAASRGFFRPHRDNLSPTTAHRRFALTLNLGGDYEGGELRFPEYGPMTYRPAAGEALVFSCSLLHEVTEVTRGERYALISFLFGENGR